LTPGQGKSGKPEITVLPAVKRQRSETTVYVLYIPAFQIHAINARAPWFLKHR